MRYQIRNKLLELLPTLMDGVHYIENSDMKNANLISADCHLALRSINKSLRDSLTEVRFLFFNEKLLKIESTFDLIIKKKNDNNSIVIDIYNFQKLLNRLEQSLQNEPEVKLEILFLPYKYSMWDSLESIWLSAKEDSRCDTYVMPIPYYDRNEQGGLSEYHYEGEHYLKNNIPIVSYKDYDISQRRPDIIYFHNPFDGNNLVTSVSPEFYTDKLKHYTSNLVYVPYSIVYPLKTFTEMSHPRTTGVKNANKVILQSIPLKEAYISAGVDKEKLLALGSPKIDAVINRLNEKQNSLEDEKNKGFNGSKVILINSTIGALLRDEDYLDDLKKNMQLIINKGMKIIWRPHPLLEATVSSMRKHLLNEYKFIQKYVEESLNIYQDKSSDIFSALRYSDALISDPKSSIIQSYIATGKPVYIKDESEDLRNLKYKNSDISGCYFKDEMSIEKYLEFILIGSDPKKNERVTKFKGSIINSNGNSGKQIHLNIFNEVIKSH